ncbi:MAG: tRNA glutamyl-Q(34) synthetase GluQRS [Rhodobacter sp.]|nr:tRNA glutamyl-Q(34) synthetase GluQRS [Rhodobacter sp.]
MSYVTRFAPSPTGPLHLGHAYSALTAWSRARDNDGVCLLRIEDIDQTRSRPEFERQIHDDLHWLGLDWPVPVMRQSDRFDAYRAALDRLAGLGLCYPCRCTRGDIRAVLSAPQEGARPPGPDGVIYPGTCRTREMSEATATDAIRLNIAAAMDHLGVAPKFTENGPIHHGPHELSVSAARGEIGDIVLARRDIGTSYHLAVVVDDAKQDVTEIVRGADLFTATFIHILLQDLLELPRTTYWHHDLIRDENGRRLAKRDDARAIAAYRENGMTPQQVRAMVGL